MPWDDNLEGASLQIARTTASPLRVLAGPGTGKTFALIRRVARLLEENVPPKQILVATFTRTAAQDLKRELEGLNTIGAALVNSTTLHALCFSILGRRNVLEFTGRTPRPMLEFEKRFLLEDLRQMGVGNIYDLEKLLRAFAAAWARDQKDKPGWPSSPRDQQFESHLHDWLMFHEAMLIEELVPEALRFLRLNPESDERAHFSQILVDEYQDLNVSEQEFITFISENAKLTIIGDEDQSIYSFKHAHPEGIAKFHERHPDTTDLSLVVCRRCPENIVEIASRLISHNRQRTKRKLCALPESEPANVQVVQWQSMEQEAQGITKYIERLVKDGLVEPGRILVLAPRKEFGNSVREELMSRDVQVQSFFKEQALDGDPKDIEKCRAQEAFTLLTLAANPNDYVALRCWCGFGSPSLRSGAWLRIRKKCEESELSLTETIAKIKCGETILSRGSQIVERLQELEIRLSALATLHGHELFDTLFPKDDPDFEQIRNALAEDIGPDTNVQQLLDNLRASITQPELPTVVDFVRVMSLHKSKGLTADLVIVMGCIEGLIPNVTETSSLEEQRRLFYVAITRARKFLVLSSVQRLSVRDAYRMRFKVTGRRSHVGSNSTKFIDELGPNCPDSVTGAEFLTVNNLV